MRDEHADYLAAYKTTYESCVQAGRTEDADEIARILRDGYGYDVAEPKGADDKAKKDTAAPERADDKAPEDTAEPRPARRKPTARGKAAE
jgi:hypothetical protein